MSHSPRIALVTGATRGIGLETVRQLATAGVHTLLAGRDHARAVETARALQIDGLPVEAITLDVTDEAGIKAAAAEVGRRHGRLDILVNNAGIMRNDFEAPVSQQPLDAWRETFDTNLFGVVAVTQAFLLLLRATPRSRSTRWIRARSGRTWTRRLCPRGPPRIGGWPPSIEDGVRALNDPPCAPPAGVDFTPPAPGAG